MFRPFWKWLALFAYRRWAVPGGPKPVGVPGNRDAIRFRILAWRDSTPAWKRWLLWRVLGRDYCPHCERVVRWDWRGLSVHEDGPPLFAEWVCRECGTGTGLEPTEPMRKALESRL